MTEKAVWYYKKTDQKEGPVSHGELQKMLDQGEIDSTTKVWTSNFSDWVTISEVEHFNLSGLDDTPTIEVGRHEAVYERETDLDTIRPRPWVRFWARMVDYSLLVIVISFLSTYFGSLYTFQPYFTMSVLFIWVFIETFLMATVGTTPGKWLLRVTVRDRLHQKLSFSDAISRSFSVWWLGLGAGIPIISLITMIVASVKLSNAGATSWDRRSRYCIFHGKIGTIRTIITSLYFICYFWLFSWGQFNLIYFHG